MDLGLEVEYGLSGTFVRALFSWTTHGAPTVLDDIFAGRFPRWGVMVSLGSGTTRSWVDLPLGTAALATWGSHPRVMTRNSPLRCPLRAINRQ